MHFVKVCSGYSNNHNYRYYYLGNDCMEKKKHNIVDWKEEMNSSLLSPVEPSIPTPLWTSSVYNHVTFAAIIIPMTMRGLYHSDVNIWYFGALTKTSDFVTLFCSLLRHVVYIE